jgi:hypothetical protein
MVEDCRLKRLTFIILSLIATNRWLILDISFVALNRHRFLAFCFAPNDQLMVSVGIVPTHHEFSSVISFIGWNDVTLDSDVAIIKVAVALTLSIDVRHGKCNRCEEMRGCVSWDDERNS